MARMIRRTDGKPWYIQPGALGVVGLLILAALLLGIALQPLAVDDAYVTFRYARNLSAGNGFTYNQGQAALSTTAPLYALILSAGVLAWPDLPSLANALSAVAIATGAFLLVALGRREGNAWLGALAGLFYVLCPLLWLSLGLETGLFLALSLAAILSYRCDRPYLAAILLALATLTRGDGPILAGVLALHWGIGRLRRKRRAQGEVVAGRPGPLEMAAAAVIYVVVMVPVLAWLAWRFGSPLPATLATKQAQAELGITGFYPHTTYLEGITILARARLEQSLLYLLYVPAVLAGAVAAWKQARWLLLILGWGLAHLAAYSVLGVTPYYWYYAPAVVSLLSLAAAGVVEGARWLGARLGRHDRLARLAVGGLWALGLALALVRSDWAMVQALEGPVPPPEDPVSKVLPEAKAGVYTQAGQWLAAYTAPQVTVGVTEVGIVGYYAGRTMVDFLGLLQPEVAEALARGDLYWALLRYQPDYLVLTAISPLYAYDLRADPWFQAAYAPVQSFEDPRFWGSPLTIYQRQVPRTALVEDLPGELPSGALALGVDLGSTIRLLGAAVETTSVHPGDTLHITLFWQALQPVDGDYKVFVHLLGEYDRVIAQRDAVPGLGARPTSQWQQGQVIADPHLLALPEVAYAPDMAVWEVGLYDAETGVRLPVGGGSDNVRFGQVEVLPRTEPLWLDFGRVALTGYELDRLALVPGETLGVKLYWTGEGPASINLALVSELGGMLAVASGDPSQAVYALNLPADAPNGAYYLEMMVTDPATGEPLPLLGADGQPRTAVVNLTKVRLYR